MKTRRSTGMTPRRAPCACSPTARACTAASCGATTAGASRSTARAATASATTSSSPSRLTTAPPRLVFNGFQKNWSVQDWSPDDTKLLIRNFVSANESHLYVMDIATAALTPVSEGEGPRACRRRSSRRRPRRLPHHQSRQRVRAAAARGSGHRRGGNAHRPHSLGHRQLSRAATTAATSPGWRTSTA